MTISITVVGLLGRSYEQEVFALACEIRDVLFEVFPEGPTELISIQATEVFKHSRGTNPWNELEFKTVISVFGELVEIERTFVRTMYKEYPSQIQQKEQILLDFVFRLRGKALDLGKNSESLKEQTEKLSLKQMAIAQ